MNIPNYIVRDITASSHDLRDRLSRSFSGDEDFQKDLNLWKNRPTVDVTEAVIHNITIFITSLDSSLIA